MDQWAAPGWETPTWCLACHQPDCIGNCPELAALHGPPPAYPNPLGIPWAKLSWTPGPDVPAIQTQGVCVLCGYYTEADDAIVSSSATGRSLCLRCYRANVPYDDEPRPPRPAQDWQIAANEAK